MPDTPEGGPPVSGIDVAVSAHLEGRLLELISENQRQQYAQQTRLLLLIVVGGVLNTTIVSLITGASLAVDLGFINVQSGGAPTDAPALEAPGRTAVPADAGELLEGVAPADASDPDSDAAEGLEALAVEPPGETPAPD